MGAEADFHSRSALYYRVPKPEVTDPHASSYLPSKQAVCGDSRVLAVYLSPRVEVSADAAFTVCSAV